MCISAVTVAQMREVDRLMIEEMEIVLLQMMENAGRGLAVLARRMLGGDARGRRVVVLAGSGGNGGGGLVAARRLSMWGADVSVLLAPDREELRDVPLHQLRILDRMGVPTRVSGAGPEDGRLLASAELVLDALIGYSLRGAPRGPTATLIQRAGESGARVLALDIPSGLDGDTGHAFEPAIRAAATLTLALPKRGLLHTDAAAWVGDLYVADISVPEEVYRRLGLSVGPVFARDDIVPVLPATGSDGSPRWVPASLDETATGQ